MSKNRVQFQKGMSLSAFMAQYGTRGAVPAGAVCVALAAGVCVSELRRTQRHAR